MTNEQREDKPLSGKPQQTWTDSIIAHYELLDQTVSKLPANERLEVEQLNKMILGLMDSVRAKFLFMMSLHGFSTAKTKKGDE